MARLTRHEDAFGHMVADQFFATPWLDYLFASPSEVGCLIRGTGGTWRTRSSPPADHS